MAERFSATSSRALNPADRREIIGTAPLSTKPEVDQAVAAAKKAYHAWSELSWVKRAEYVDNFAQLLKRDLNEISALVTRECGKAINEGRADAVEALHMAQYIAGLGPRPERLYRELRDRCEGRVHPAKVEEGVVACITPYVRNFRFGLSRCGSFFRPCSRETPSSSSQPSRRRSAGTS